MSLLQPSGRCLIDFLQEKSIAPPQLCLVDVGVSGGIYPDWRRWGAQLCGVGVDVIIDEVERLAAEEKNPAMRYLAAKVGLPKMPDEQEEQSKPKPTTYALHRTQAYLAAALLRRPEAEPQSKSLWSRLRGQSVPQPSNEVFRKLWHETVTSSQAPTEANYANVAYPAKDPFFGYYLERFAQKRESRLSDRLTSVDKIVAESGLSRVDVLKIDTDGYDFDVLQGAEQVLSQCLAVEIEVQFQGPVGPDANVFCNIDGFLRQKGFSLMSLEPYTYGRSALPQPFLYDIPAQTKRGPLAWADALYMRDIAEENYATRFGFTAMDDQRRNLVLLADLYGLEDVAADGILACPGLFGVPDESLLDALSAKVYGPHVRFEHVTQAFLADPLKFPDLLKSSVA